MLMITSINAIDNFHAINEISFQSIHTERNNRTEPTSNNAFESFFDAAVRLLNETNELQIRDEQLQLDLAMGKTDDMLAVVLAQQKAFASLNFTVQVTNRLIEAYREIMRIGM